MTIHTGDCLEWLRGLPPGIAHCCVTSPPYFGLRAYGGGEQEIGSEKTPEEYIGRLVEVFREMRRVLRSDGLLWLNLGDSYADDTKWGGRTGGRHAYGLHGEPVGRRRTNSSLKPGDLLNIPHRVASALQADGWWWRSTVVWAKRGPMPESVAGVRWARSKKTGEWVLRRGRWRPTNSHEYLFEMAPSERYFADGEAVREKSSQPRGIPKQSGHKKYSEFGHKGTLGSNQGAETRNPRTVQFFAPESFKGAHFACFPSSIPHWCIRSSTSEQGCCPTCGACLAPMVESERKATRPGIDTKCLDHSNGRGGVQAKRPGRCVRTGSRPSKIFSIGARRTRDRRSSYTLPTHDSLPRNAPGWPNG